MGCLIGRDVIRRGSVLHIELFRPHRLDDFCELVGQKLVLLDLILLEIHRDTHQRPAEAVSVGRVEVEVDIPMGVEASVHAGTWLDCR